MKARRRLRIALVSTAICLLGVLSYFFLSSSHGSGHEATEKIDLSEECLSDAIVIKGFRQTVAEGARTIYDLWAQTATLRVETREYSLQGVLPASTYFGEKGRRVSFSADEGIYEPHSDNVILRRNVMAMLSTGLTLRCDEVRFSRSEMTASSECPVVVTGEGIRFHAKGFSVDLLSQEILFPSVIHVESDSSPTEVMQLLGDEDRAPSSQEALEEGFLLKANRMLVRISEKTAELTGDVAFRLGENELFAELALFGWGKKLREIEWGKLDGVVVVKTPDGAVGCEQAEYRDGRLVLQGKPLLVHDFDRLGAAGRDHSADGTQQGPWPTPWSSFESGRKERGRASFFGARDRFTVLRSAARYLGCSTLSAEKMIYEEGFGRFSARGSVILSLSGSAGMAESAPVTCSRVLAHSLDVDLDAKRAHFAGGTVLTHGQNSISANTLSAGMKSMGRGDVQIESLDFGGSVEARVLSPDRSKGPDTDARLRLVRLHAQELSVDTSGGEVHCSGDVSIHSQDQALSCQELQMTLSEGMSGIERLVARESVVLETQGRMATGGKFVFDGLRNVAELTRQPKVWYGENVILGRKVFYDLQTGNLSVIDRVNGVFYSEKELGVGQKGEGGQEHTSENEATLSLSDSIRRPGKVELSADRLDYNEKTMEGSYSGGVVVRKGEAVFSADSIKMIGDPASGKIETLEARGNVRVQDGLRVLRAERAIYYDDEQKVVLFGSPKVYEFGKIITRGTLVTLYLKKKEYEIKGEDETKIKTTFFVPEKR